MAIINRIIAGGATQLSTVTVTHNEPAYTGSPIYWYQDVVLKDGSKTLTKGVDYDFSSGTESAINRDYYYITLIGKGDYEGTKTLSWTIDYARYSIKTSNRIVVSGGEEYSDKYYNVTSADGIITITYSVTFNYPLIINDIDVTAEGAIPTNSMKYLSDFTIISSNITHNSSGNVTAASMTFSVKRNTTTPNSPWSINVYFHTPNYTYPVGGKSTNLQLWFKRTV